MALTQAQRAQVDRQLAFHRHTTFTTALQVESLALPNFSLISGVFRADIMASSQKTGEFLVRNPSFYQGKHTLDMGCGSGLLGIVMLLKDAHKVTFADFSPFAISNTNLNLRRLGLVARADVLLSDLFEHVSGRFDFIVFNHPFFADVLIEGVPVSATMLAPPSLLRRFLERAKEYLNPQAPILMPFLHMAGEENNPASVAPSFGFTVEEVHRETLDTKNVQIGDFSIYVLRLV